MNVLLIRLAGPMQSWGTQSRFTIRDTGIEPSKSGVIGLICAALGRSRSDSVEDLARLCMGVRIDQEGKIASDYHTTQDVIKAGGDKPKLGEAVVSTRYYLSDADFLVGLASEDLDLLKEIDSALANPHWPLFLGRKAFPPAKPVHLPDGLRENQELRDALVTYPRYRLPKSYMVGLNHEFARELLWREYPTDQRGSYFRLDNEKLNETRVSSLRLVIEDPTGEAVRVDQPVSSFAERRFAPRHVRTEFVQLSEIPVIKEAPCIYHY